MEMETDKNKQHYNKQYQYNIEYKYKTNTRYQRYLTERLEKFMDGEITSVLDIGAGQGLNTALLAKDYPRADVLGIDLSEVGIQFAKCQYSNLTNLTFKCLDAGDPAIYDRKYDLVTAFEVLEHIKDWKSVANQMIYATNKYIMVSAPVGRMRAYEKEHGHYRNFKKGELENYFTAKGLKCVKVFYAGFPFWSPITRDLLNLLPISDTSDIQSKIGGVKKAASLILYYLYRYCSSTSRGDQFIGLFKKIV